jgi:hypothetical protein
MRSIPSVQRLPLSTRARGTHPRGRPPATTNVAGFALGFVRGAFFGTVAALVLAGTTGGYAVADPEETIVVETGSVLVVGTGSVSEPAPAPDEPFLETFASDRGPLADPASAAGGGGSGGTPPREPSPCPGYGSMEDLLAASRAS